ncbi:MAG TPA: LysM domain-containing protein [Myxococcaceae bacterium]|nr:LysM domain-containing protein [Myxococcaceae bacterium]
MAQKKAQQAKKTQYQLWQETVQDAVTNAAWDLYDTTIKLEVSDYNTRLSGTPGYTKVDWLLLKAMVWVESGGPKSKAWKTRPMQIGNSGDPGYSVVKNGQEGASLIMSTRLKSDIASGNINEPNLNIRAGIAYVFTRMAKFSHKSVVDQGAKPFTYKVVSGDNFAQIADKVGSTTEVLQSLNPGKKTLAIGDVITCRKASVQRVITGWLPFDTKTLAARYNIGDARYADKLDYVLSLFKELKRT